MELLHTDKLDDVQKYVSGNGFTEYILNSSNVEGDKNGFSYTMMFDDVKTNEFPGSIMFSNRNGFLALTGIKDVSFEKHILGMLMRVLTKTGMCMTIICR